MVRALGFTWVEETAVGAQVVARKYKDLSAGSGGAADLGLLFGGGESNREALSGLDTLSGSLPFSHGYPRAPTQETVWP